MPQYAAPGATGSAVEHRSCYDHFIGEYVPPAERGAALLVVADHVESVHDTLHGVEAGVWSRDGSTAHRANRGSRTGRVRMSNFRSSPEHAAFADHEHPGSGGKPSEMMLNHCQRSRNTLVSYSTNAMGLY